MSAPLYSPLFIYPPTKKRRAPRRGRPRARPEPIDNLGTIIDVRRRPPKDAIGNGECISLPPISMQGGSSSKDMGQQVMDSADSHFEQDMTPHQIHGVVVSMQDDKPMMSKHTAMSSQMAYEETIASKDYYVANDGSARDLGPEDIPTEVEVDVEIEASDSMPRLRPRVARQIAEPVPQHHQQQHRAVVHYESAMPIDFDPQACNDIEVLRHRLMEAYGELDEMQHMPPTVQHLQNENEFLRETIARHEDRIQQLESILLERNMNLRQLLSENFLMSARLKRLQSEFGVDAVKDALKGLS